MVPFQKPSDSQALLLRLISLTEAESPHFLPEYVSMPPPREWAAMVEFAEASVLPGDRDELKKALMKLALLTKHGPGGDIEQKALAAGFLEYLAPYPHDIVAKAADLWLTGRAPREAGESRRGVFFPALAEFLPICDHMLALRKRALRRLYEIKQAAEKRRQDEERRRKPVDHAALDEIWKRSTWGERPRSANPSPPSPKPAPKGISVVGALTRAMTPAERAVAAVVRDHAPRNPNYVELSEAEREAALDRVAGGFLRAPRANRATVQRSASTSSSSWT